MGIEIDLLRNYPKAKRNVKQRGSEKTAEDRALARKFGKEFFDGDRSHGYGGFNYDPRFWTPVIPDFIDHFELTDACSLLDVGCAKGFMLYDLKKALPSLSVRGIDISEYAINNSKHEVKEYLSVGDASKLHFPDNQFDVGISITTIHNLQLEDCCKALLELQRVSKRGCFVTLDAYRNEEEKMAMESWNLTAKTMMHVDEWKLLFKDIGFEGDYFWFIP